MSRRASSRTAAAASASASANTTPAQPPPPPPAPAAIPKPKPKAAPRLGSRTLVLDPGAYTLKAGFASDSPNAETDCHAIPNCLAKSARDDKTYIGSQLHSCVDYGEMQFKRPVQKGYIVNWPTQTAVFDHEFFNDPKSSLYCDPTDTNLVISEAPNAPLAIQRNIDEIVFEGFEFASAYRTTAPILNSWTETRSVFGDPPNPQTTPPQPAECLLVVDSGYSHTTITPLLHGRPINPAARRMTIGGKHMTNYLAELISLRHFSLIDEPHIVDQIKQDCCFVSSDFASDLDHCWKGAIGDIPRPATFRDESIVVDYVLPDYETLHRGYMRPHDRSHSAKLARLGLSSSNVDPVAAAPTAKEEVFPLGNERFVIPELLFNPTDIGLSESGIPDSILQSLSHIPRSLWQGFLGNILLAGGNSLIKGMVERVEREVRARVPVEYVVRVKRAGDPIKNAWLGGARLASRKDVVKEVVVTREEYLENGAVWAGRQFATRRVT